MNTPEFFKGNSVSRLLQGAAAGAVVTMIVGFNWGGWVTGGTARDGASKAASAATVAALSPICVDKFQHSANAASNMAELKKVSSYQQASFIEKGGWATLPGSDSVNSAVARDCGQKLQDLPAVQAQKG